MGSGTPFDPTGVRNLTGAAAEAMGGDTPPAFLGMTPRQQEAHQAWGYYTSKTYEGRRVAWDGSPAFSPAESGQVGYAGQVPDGFVDSSRGTLPLRFRKPFAPYPLVRRIVRRLTALLFSAKRHPQLRVAGDADAEAFIRAVAETTRLWATMNLARNMGGGMGAVGIGFVVSRGRPAFEVHDARWSEPRFSSRFDQTLVELEKRQAYPQNKRNPETGEVEQRWFWYRRLITDKVDAVWEGIPAVQGEEPPWDILKPTRIVEHGFGECPVVWIQNSEVLDEVDGEPDCTGCYDIVHEIDTLTAQAIHGTVQNCDPTLLLETKLEMERIKKGSDNAIVLEPGDGGEYLEIAGHGPKTAMELAEKLEERVCGIARVVLEKSRAHATQGGAKTATELDKDYSAMWECADELREQYGEQGVRRLLEMVLRIARRRFVLGGEPPLVLPPREQTDPETGEVTYTTHTPGIAEAVELLWPKYEQPTVNDAGKAASAVKQAREAGVLDRESGVRFVAPFFNVEDAGSMLARLAAEEAQGATPEE